MTLILSKVDDSDRTTAQALIGGDWFATLSGIAGTEHVRVDDISQLGPYLKVTFSGPIGKIDHVLVRLGDVDPLSIPKAKPMPRTSP